MGYLQGIDGFESSYLHTHERVAPGRFEPIHDDSFTSAQSHAYGMG